MKIFKKFFSVFFAGLLVASLTVNANAAAIAGDDTYNCNVDINFSIDTEKYHGEEIKVQFNDVTNTVSQTVVLNAENAVALTLIGPTTYNITVEGLPEGCQINDAATGTKIKDKMAISESFKTLDWVLTDLTDVSSAVDEEIKEYTVENEEAENVYKAFLDKVSFIENDSSWSIGIAALLNQYGEKSVNQRIYSEAYAKYVEGGTVEEYFAMSPYEQFLWMETYVKLAENINSGWGFDFFFADKASFEKNHTSLTTNLMNGNNADVVKEAYLELMDWQYNYIKEKGVPFNFIRNRSYLEEIGGTTVPSGERDTEKETVVEETPEEPTEEKGIWDDTMDKLASNALVVVIALVLAAAGGILAYRRKLKNVDDKDY